MIVVAARFPVARLVAGNETHARDPLRALPEIEIRDDDPSRCAMRACERLPLVLVREHHARREGLRKSHVRRVTAKPLEDDMARRRLHLRARGKVGELHAGPLRIEDRPLRDAVDITGLIDLRHLEELAHVERERLLHFTGHLQPPTARARITLDATHRPDAAQQVLTRRQPRTPIRTVRRARLPLLLFTGQAVARAAQRNHHRAERRGAHECPPTHRRCESIGEVRVQGRVFAAHLCLLAEEYAPGGPMVTRAREVV